ncbi:MAG: metallophosphoesterase [Pyrinomonadaceae bacterium]
MSGRPGSSAKRRILLAGVVCGIGIVLVLLTYSFFIEPDRLIVNNQSIELQSSSEFIRNLKIVVWSDLHAGSEFIDTDKIEKVVELTNQQKPDLVFLLGDFVSQVRGTSEPRPLNFPIEKAAKILGGLKARNGVFAVIGNHDDWYDREAVTSELTSAGIKVLFDSVEEVAIDGGSISLIGLRDFLSIGNEAEYAARIKELGSKSMSKDLIVLAHNPDSLELMIRKSSVPSNTRLFLAGHTHGGQVWLPLLGRPIVPSNYGQKYAAGRGEAGGVKFFVTTGIGTSLLPVRFMVPPEIAVLEFK